MTREELREVVVANTSRSDKETVINLALNLGQKRLAMLHDFMCLKATASDIPISSGDLSVAIPDTVKSVVSVSLINGQQSYPVGLRSKEWFVKTYPNPSALVTGNTPRHAYVEGSSLYFAPTSNGTYAIRLDVNQWPTDFASDASTPSITGSDEALIAFATAYVFKSIGEIEEATIWNGEFNQAAVTLIGDDDRQPGVTHVAEPVNAGLGMSLVESPDDPFAGFSRRGGW